MNTYFKNIFFTALLILLANSRFYAQLSVSSNTACPNQQVVLTASWPNVAPTGYTITKTSPVVGGPTVQPGSGSNPSFTVSDAGPGAITVIYTIQATGNALSGPVTATATASLTIQPPAPLVVSNTTNYCHNATATITVPFGAPSYNVTGPAGTGPFSPFPTNVINIPNLVAPTSVGVYTIVGNYAGCIKTGTTSINVSPNSQIAITSSLTVCMNSNTTNLVATLANVTPVSGSFYNWTGPYISANANATGLNAVPNQTANAGIYSVDAYFAFNTVTCKRTATTAISVVETSTVSVVASPSATRCQGSNVSLSANVNTSGSGNAPLYSWLGPNGFNSSSATPALYNLTAANSGVYTITAIFSNGFLSCTTTSIIPVQVIATVPPNPSGPSNICQNTNLTLSVAATGATSFTWSGPTSSLHSNLQSPTFTNIQTSGSGLYYVYAEFGNAATSCSTSAFIAVNVVPVNTITVYPPQPVCVPNNALLQANAINATSYSWDGPNGNAGYQATTVLYHPPVTYSGIYTITAGFSSGGLTCYSNNTVSVTILPLLNFTLPPPQIVCYNSDVFLSGPAGATSYNWASSGGFSANTQTIEIHSIQLSGSGTYSLEVNLNGCTTSATTNISVITPIQFSQPFFDRTICKGDSIHMEAPLSGGSGNYAYMWYPGNFISPITTSATSGRPEGTTVYNVLAYDVTCPTNSISADIRVDVKQPPSSANLHLDKTEGCSPLCMTYDAHVGPETAWVTYDFGGNLQYQQNTPTVCLDPGTYTLNVITTGTNGCSGATVYPSTIYVYPSPNLDIATIPESPTINDDVVFTASTSHTVSSYMWIFDNTALSNPPDTSYAANPQKSPGIAGFYPVVLIATTNMGCADTAFKLVEIREDFNVFIPNAFTPNGDDVNDVFQIKGSGLNPDKFSMDLLDRKSGTMFSTRDLNAAWDGTVNGSKVQQGVYVYKIIVVGLHGEGKKEFTGQFLLLR